MADTDTLLAFKAGRAFRRGGTNFVDPNPTKGAILLTLGDDGLLHFIWKNRTNDQVEEVRYMSFTLI
jgi:26S proteasome regulatory subunit N13